VPTTAGSVALEGSIPPSDAFITRQLREAGAITRRRSAWRSRDALSASRGWSPSPTPSNRRRSTGRPRVRLRCPPTRSNGA